MQRIWTVIGVCDLLLPGVFAVFDIHSDVHIVMYRLLPILGVCDKGKTNKGERKEVSHFSLHIMV